jgi:hypothetical protein
MGVKIQLFEVGITSLDFCLWGWIKSDVYKEKVSSNQGRLAKLVC